MKKILIISLSVIAIVAGGGFYYYTTTPKYSLMKVVSAYKSHDLAAFKKYVAIDDLVSSLIDESMAAAMKDNEYEASSKFAEGFAKIIKPAITKAGIKEIEKLVETGDFSSTKDTKEKPKMSFDEILKGKKFKANNFHGVEYTKKDGKIALVGLKFRDARLSEDFVFDIKMRDQGSYWQVVSVENYGEILSKSKKIEKEILAERNQAIINRIGKYISATHFVFEDEGKHKYDKKITTWFTIKNTGDKDIKEFDFEFTIRNKKNTVSVKKSVISRNNIIPSDEEKTLGWTYEINPYMQDDVDLHKLMVIGQKDSSKLSVDMKFTRILLGDGTEIETLNSI